MCGIFCSVSRSAHLPPSQALRAQLAARGPDASRELQLPSRLSAEQATDAYVTLFSTVLSLRGEGTTQQPYQTSSHGPVLCWNGEAWTMQGAAITDNDTARVHARLIDALDSPGNDDIATACKSVACALAQFEGPYAFVLYDAPRARIFLGRDVLGRRSLLYKVTERGEVFLSSVSDGRVDGVWTEVDADGVYCLDLRQHMPCDPAAEQRLFWGKFAISRVTYIFTNDDCHSVVPSLALNRLIPQAPPSLEASSARVRELDYLLRESLRHRVTRIPEPPLNVAGLKLPDAKVAVLFSGGLDCTVLARLSHDLLPAQEPVDLINVAFENPRVHKSSSGNPYELCPDRTTGRASFSELCRVCPDRQWRLVTVDVPYEETQRHRLDVLDLMHPHNTEMDLSIAFALYFAARGRGMLVQGLDGAPMPYICSARVLLSGLGADELFAGYTRHATAFARGGHLGLLNELELDVGRLGKRNLGRDDRVMSSWAREARFPFLDEKVVAWALGLSVTEKCGFGVPLAAPEGGNQSESADLEPGKRILRLLAWEIGMKSAAHEKKRAIQFGARTAKMTTGKIKGTQTLS